MDESVENHTEFNTEPDDKGQLNERNAAIWLAKFTLTWHLHSWWEIYLKNKKKNKPG